MKQRIAKIGSSLMVFLATATPVLAANIAGATPTVGQGKVGDLGAVITLIFNFVITIGGIIFVILFLVGGIQYLTAAGDTEATGKAKKILVDAIIGLVIILAAWAIGNFILDFLGLTNLSTTGRAGGGIGGPNPGVTAP